MAFTTSDCLKGPIFEIQASKEIVPFFAHASILSQSDTLKALIEGDWKDSVDRIIKLPDWDADTVGCLLEWLYQGDYHTILEPSAPPRPNQQKQAVSHNANSSVPGDTIAGRSSTEVALGASSRMSQPERKLIPISDQHFDGHPNVQRRSSLVQKLHWDHTRDQVFNALLVHAKIYCLANYLLLPSLQALAFENLKELFINLEDFIAEPPALSTLVTLVRYVYGNTARPCKGEEPLQRLLTTFITQNAAIFTDNKWGAEVSQLMEEGGDFTADVWAKASAHISSLEDIIENQNNVLNNTQFDGWGSKPRRNAFGGNQLPL